jgi:hypothetical protein
MCRVKFSVWLARFPGGLVFAAYIYGFVVNDYDYGEYVSINLARSFVVLEATLAQYLLYVYL